MAIEEELLEIYQNSELHVKPEQLSKRGGARYSEVAINLVNSIWNDSGDVQVVNVLNKGAIPFLKDTDAVEVCAKIGKNGATPIPVTGVITDHMKEYISQVKAYERHAVKAAIYGDKNEAMRALVINPLVGDLKTASACFDEMLEAHKDYLPQFFKEEK
jgi:6-phospho-beta-glucosidase